MVCTPSAPAGTDLIYSIPYVILIRYAESVEKGGRVNWRKVPVKLFEADLGRNDVQVSNPTGLLIVFCCHCVGEGAKRTSVIIYERLVFLRMVAYLQCSNASNLRSDCCSSLIS